MKINTVGFLAILMCLIRLNTFGQMTYLNFDGTNTSPSCNAFGDGNYNANKVNGAAWYSTHGAPTLSKCETSDTYYNCVELSSSHSSGNGARTEGVAVSYNFLSTHKYAILISDLSDHFTVSGIKVLMTQSSNLPSDDDMNCTDEATPSLASAPIVLGTYEDLISIHSLYFDNYVPASNCNVLWLHSLMSYTNVSGYVTFKYVRIEDKGLVNNCNITIENQTTNAVHTNKTSVTILPTSTLTPDFIASAGGCGEKIGNFESDYSYEYVEDPVKEDRPFLKVYPNPAMETATVELILASEENVRISLSNMLGKEIKTIAMGRMSSVRKTFSVEGLESGIYLVHYYVGDKVHNAEMLMIE